MANDSVKPGDFMEDELAAAFLDDDAPVAQSDPAVSDEWDDDDSSDTPGELAVDVYESADRIYVKARTAGVNKDDLDVSISDNVLTVSGTLSSGDEIEAENYHIQECYWGAFSRSISLPTAIKEDEVEAVLRDGVLTISFTKQEQETVKKIQVT